MGKKGEISGGSKKPSKKKKTPASKRDSDKDEVERDDLKHEDIVELVNLDGKQCWTSITTSFTGNIVNGEVYTIPKDSGNCIYKFRKGMTKPVPKMVSRSERAVYDAVVIGTHKKGRAYLKSS
jgi:hypothetical protein